MKFSYTKNLESVFFCKESKSNKQNILAVGRGGGGDMARVSDSFFQKNPSLKKMFPF